MTLVRFSMEFQAGTSDIVTVSLDLKAETDLIVETSNKLYLVQTIASEYQENALYNNFQ